MQQVVVFRGPGTIQHMAVQNRAKSGRVLMTMQQHPAVCNLVFNIPLTTCGPKGHGSGSAAAGATAVNVYIYEQRSKMPALLAPES